MAPRDGRFHQALVRKKFWIARQQGNFHFRFRLVREMRNERPGWTMNFPRMVARPSSMGTPMSAVCEGDFW
jgi:hypothetical protein